MSSGLSRRFLAMVGGETLARILAFCATIYLARTLSPSGYGVVGVVMGVMLYLTQLADGGVELLGVSLVAREPARAGELAGPVLTMRLALASTLLVGTVVVSLAVLPPLDGRMLAVASAGLLATAASVRWVLLGLERASAIAVARTVGEAAVLGLVLLLVRGPNDAMRVPVALVAGTTVTAVLLLRSLAAAGVRIRWRWAPADVRALGQRARHLVAFTLLGLLLFNFDLIFLRISAGPAAAGWYAAAYTLIAFAANLIVAFAHTVLPVLARAEAAPGDRVATYHSACAQAFAVALPAGLGASLLATGIIGLVFGGAYHEGALALRWLAWAIPLAALRELPVIGLLAAGREDQLLKVNAWSAATNVGLVLWLVPRFGLVGAAAATVATELVRLALALRYAATAGYPVLPRARAWRAAVGSAAMAAVLWALPSVPILIAVAAGGITYAVMLAITGAIRWHGRVPALTP